MTHVLSVRIDEHLKKSLERVSSGIDTTESELVRFFVLEGLNLHKLELSPKQQSTDERVDLIYTPILLPYYIKELAKQRSRSKGMRLGRWIAALVQSNILGKAVVVNEEIIALRESNRNLLAIGRNLNQIAKALNENFYEVDRVKIEILSELKRAIQEDHERIDELLAAAQKSWCTS